MGIKLKDILLEGLNKKAIIDVVNKVYPYIVKKLGGSTVKIEVHANIWKRVDAVGIEDLLKVENPSAEYDWEANKIYLYQSRMKNVEEVIKALLHEHTHSKQDRKKMKAMYDSGKTYKNHPFEKQAHAAEKTWKNYLKYLDD